MTSIITLYYDNTAHELAIFPGTPTSELLTFICERLSIPSTSKLTFTNSTGVITCLSSYCPDQTKLHVKLESFCLTEKSLGKQKEWSKNLNMDPISFFDATNIVMNCEVPFPHKKIEQMSKKIDFAVVGKNSDWPYAIRSAGPAIPNEITKWTVKITNNENHGTYFHIGVASRIPYGNPCTSFNPYVTLNGNSTTIFDVILDLKKEVMMLKRNGLALYSSPLFGHPGPFHLSIWTKIKLLVAEIEGCLVEEESEWLAQESTIVATSNSFKLIN